MKKYWNKLIVAAIAIFAAGAVACSDDTSELPGYYTENFAYLELYPDTNTASALSATHDARGVFVEGSFADFQVKLKWPVQTDTKIVLGGDPELAASGHEAIPESAVAFAPVDLQTGETVAGDIVIPAGKSSVTVRATLLDTSFAIENRAASKYMYTAVIRQISGSKDVYISSNKNSVAYPIEVDAFVENLLAISSDSGSEYSVIEGTNNPLGITVGTDFEDIQLEMVYGVETDTRVVLEADPTLIEEGMLALPDNAVTFFVNDQPVAGKTIVIPAGEASLTVQVRLTDKSFIDPDIEEETAYVLPMVIKSVSGSENVIIDPNNKVINFGVVIPDLTNYMLTPPTEGTLQTDRSGYTSYVLLPDDPEKHPCPELFDNKTSSYVYWDGDIYAICVDLGSKQDVMGFCTKNFSRYYAPLDVDVYTSEDGEAWTLALELRSLPSTSQHDIGLFAPLNTRYLKYDIIEPQPYGLALTEFYIYAK